MRSVVHKAFHEIRETGRMRLFRSYRDGIADGEQQRDFLYVKDAVEATLHFAEKATDVGGLFNVGSGEANTWLAVADALFAAMGKQKNVEFIEMPEPIVIVAVNVPSAFGVTSVSLIFTRTPGRSSLTRPVTVT